MEKGGSVTRCHCPYTASDRETTWGTQKKRGQKRKKSISSIEKVADETTVRLAELSKVIESSKNRRLMRREAKIGLSRYDFVRHQVFRYLKLIQKGVKRMKASQMCYQGIRSSAPSLSRTVCI